ncbi:hypothetical protein evm_002519 [Chilo suppressalis]|nr:hypothetical protein evm_002519 [Chilo suppressalis]
MLLISDDLYSVTEFGDGEIFRRPQAENGRMPLEIRDAGNDSVPIDVNLTRVVLRSDTMKTLLRHDFYIN